LIQLSLGNHAISIGVCSTFVNAAIYCVAIRWFSAQLNATTVTYSSRYCCCVVYAVVLNSVDCIDTTGDEHLSQMLRDTDTRHALKQEPCSSCQKYSI